MQSAENPYLLLTPGPLSTSPGVRSAMLRDWCTWDDDYNLGIVTPLRKKLESLASATSGVTSVLMQGSGTFCVESMIGTFLPANGRLLVATNGAYGDRIAQIAERLCISLRKLDFGEVSRVEPAAVARELDQDPTITHVAVVHGETTTGMLNPVREIGREVRARGRIMMVDAMSTFGGVPLDMQEWEIDILVSSANKCLQGVPGFGFLLARRELLESCKGRARSLALDAYDQWTTMESGKGKWRYTSPTHTVRALAQAVQELDREGGVEARYRRYCANHEILVEGYTALGLLPLLPREWMSPVITSFRHPTLPGFTFTGLYNALKQRGFVIYPGKVSVADCFRVGTIGHVFPDDFRRLVTATGDVLATMR